MESLGSININIDDNIALNSGHAWGDTIISGNNLIIETNGIIIYKKNKYYVPLISNLPSQIVYTDDIDHSYITIILKYDFYHLINDGFDFSVCNDICNTINSYIWNQKHHLPDGESNGQLKKIRCEDINPHYICGNIECLPLRREKIKLMWDKNKWITLYRRNLN